MSKIIKNKRGLELVTSRSSGYKTTSANLCKPIYDTINYSTFICPFESRKCGKRKKIQKFGYLENEKSFLDVNKIILHSF